MNLNLPLCLNAAPPSTAADSQGARLHLQTTTRLCHLPQASSWKTRGGQPALSQEVSGLWVDGKNFWQIRVY